MVFRFSDYYPGGGLGDCCYEMVNSLKYGERCLQ